MYVMAIHSLWETLYHSNGTCSTVIIPCQFDQPGPAYTIKVPWEDLESTKKSALTQEFDVFREPEHPQKHPTLDKISSCTTFPAALRLPFKQYVFLSEDWMFLEMFLFAKRRKF